MICAFCKGFCIEAINFLAAYTFQSKGNEKPMCKECFEIYVKALSESERLRLK